MFEIRSCWRTLRCSALGRRHRRCQPRAPAAGVRNARRACISPERFVVAIPGVATTAVATGTGQATAAGVTAGGASDHNHHPRRNSTCHSPRWRHNRRHYRRCHNNRRYSKCRGVTFGSCVQPSALGAGQRPRRRWGAHEYARRTHERRHRSLRRPARHPPAMSIAASENSRPGSMFQRQNAARSMPMRSPGPVFRSKCAEAAARLDFMKIAAHGPPRSRDLLRLAISRRPRRPTAPKPNQPVGPVRIEIALTSRGVTLRRRWRRLRLWLRRG
jgi:hypothetical protein